MGKNWTPKRIKLRQCQCRNGAWGHRIVASLACAFALFAWMVVPMGVIVWQPLEGCVALRSRHCWSFLHVFAVEKMSQQGSLKCVEYQVLAEGARWNGPCQRHS